MILARCSPQEDGITPAMAEAVAEGARETGAGVTSVNTSKHRHDPNECRKADAVAFGTPDDFGYVAGGLKVFADNGYTRNGCGTRDSAQTRVGSPSGAPS